jgi:rRNA processing protein Krr1/Pno1
MCHYRVGGLVQQHNQPRSTIELDLDVDASSISYVVGSSKADPTLLTNVLHVVNTIGAGIGLDDNIDLLADAANVT